jgi:hypothetical protein
LGPAPLPGGFGRGLLLDIRFRPPAHPAILLALCFPKPKIAFTLARTFTGTPAQRPTLNFELLFFLSQGAARRIAGWAGRIPLMPCQEVAHSQSLHHRVLRRRFRLIAPRLKKKNTKAHRLLSGQRKGQRKRAELCTLHLPEALAWHSDSVSLHCRWHPDLLALLPACASPQVISCQGVPAYARRSLQTTCLAGVRSSTCSTRLDKFQYTP